MTQLFTSNSHPLDIVAEMDATPDYIRKAEAIRDLVPYQVYDEILRMAEHANDVDDARERAEEEERWRESAQDELEQLKEQVRKWQEMVERAAGEPMSAVASIAAELFDDIERFEVD